MAGWEGETTVFSVASFVHEQQEAPVREGQSKARAPWEGMQKWGVPPVLTRRSVQSVCLD